MASPPSYPEATSRPDWLALAAPYVARADYPSLCRVCRRSWSLFAPRLWGDVLDTARRAGLHPGDDLSWWFGFALDKLARVAPATRALVRVVDARDFAKDAYHFASDHHGRLVARSFERALQLFPCAHSVLIDGHADLDPARLFASLSSSPRIPLRLLSIAGCPNTLPASFFALPSLQGLIYLDASAIPGSVAPLLRSTLLPNLRILKIRSREIDDVVLQTMARTFARRLWSLDVSHNNVTDASLDVLRDWCMPARSLRTSARFAVEGRLAALSLGTAEYGPFFALEESHWSGAFSHSERYFADSPVYVAEAGALHDEMGRSDGATPIQSDLPETLTRLLSRQELHLSSGGLTRLRLSNNQVSSFGLQKLLRTSSGHLEDLDCASMSLLPRLCPARKHWPASVDLHGLLGAAHLFRPVFSSNLRIMRIHHSLVTNVPTLEAAGLSVLARTYLAETSLLERVDEAYPQAFEPDMNPRITCLTLTCIPRRSCGPLLARLTKFLRLLSVQERQVAAAAASCSSWRAPSLLRGLRRLVLEFDADPMEDGLTAWDDSVYEDIVHRGDEGFGFVTGERSRGQQSVKAASQSRREANVHSSATASSRDHSGADRDIQNSVTHDGEWNGKPYAMPVWVGPPVTGTKAVLHDYMRLVLDLGLRQGVGPATPSQVLAGAPDKSYIFQVAWCAAVMPHKLEPPTLAELAGMKDVLAELKAFRRAGRAEYMRQQHETRLVLGPVEPGEPHSFWTGTLSVSTHHHPFFS